jgi:hypothetical protein
MYYFSKRWDARSLVLVETCLATSIGQLVVGENVSHPSELDTGTPAVDLRRDFLFPLFLRGGGE